ncbi:MAG: hypothetical protein D6808_04945 [Candidatus Dadabacteria bacterium]|nr:MAG: hypothetical protein D6808_04945 [Candidatus Dadabacteria bacterium]
MRHTGGKSAKGTITAINIGALKLMPFILGPAFGATYHYSDYTFTHIKVYLIFCLTFLFWHTLLKTLLYYLPQSQREKRERGKSHSTLIFALTVIVAALTFLSSVHLLTAYLGKEALYITLFCLALDLSWHRTSKTPLVALSILFIYYFLIGYLSFYAITVKISWQPALIAAGYSLMLTAILCLKNNFPKQLKNPRNISTTLFSAGPLLISYLSVAGELPKHYLALLLAIIPAAQKRSFGDGSGEASQNLLQLEILLITLILLFSSLFSLFM